MMAKGMVSDAFSEETDYSEGDYCIYDNTLYQFTADHAAGEWTGEDAEATTVGAELSELNSGRLIYNGKTLKLAIITKSITITAGTITTTSFADELAELGCTSLIAGFLDQTNNYPLDVAVCRNGSTIYTDSVSYTGTGVVRILVAYI